MRKVHTFDSFLNEAKLTPAKIVAELEDLDMIAKRSLKINSSDPVYQNAALRHAWTQQIVDGVKRIGVEDIKKNWKKIYSELEEDNFHQLNLFLGLALKVDSKFVDDYLNRSKNPLNSDADAIRDFLKIDL